MIWAEIGVKILGYLKQYWAQACGVGCILFLLLWARGCGQNKILQAQLIACQTQAPQTLTATARAETKLIYKYVQGQPCPDVELTQVAASTATESAPKQSICPQESKLGIWLGGGYLAGPMGSVGVQYGSWSADGLIGIGNYGGQVRYRVLAW